MRELETVAPPIWAVAPFALLLLSIAILPLLAGRFWERNRNKALVSLGLSAPFVLWFLFSRESGDRELLHAARDYLSFIVLLGSLFVVSGGIHIRGSLSGTPIANTGMLAIGAVLANLIGTTGASMVLIRPFLRANERRREQAHLVVFFIFIVSNCGGLLTPLGDPPLFLGFLKGVPFFWTLGLWPQWLLVNLALLASFNLYDQAMLNRQERTQPGADLEAVLEHAPVRVGGGHNLAFLAAIVFVVLGKGRGWGNGGEPWPFGVQEASMLLLALAAYLSTSSSVRRSNRFTFAPIVEVAVLFAGIFATMLAPLELLNLHGASLGIAMPWQYFWATGSMSSFLDNAPTFLTFAAAVAGQHGIGLENPRYLADLLAAGPEADSALAAVACGAVFMGANTYIGNGPNFMVKAIAEEAGVRMPSFHGYMLYSAVVLLPIFVLVSLVFFR